MRTLLAMALVIPLAGCGSRVTIVDDDVSGDGGGAAEAKEPRPPSPETPAPKSCDGAYSLGAVRSITPIGGGLAGLDVGTVIATKAEGFKIDGELVTDVDGGAALLLWLDERGEPVGDSLLGELVTPYDISRNDDGDLLLFVGGQTLGVSGGNESAPSRVLEVSSEGTPMWNYGAWHIRHVGVSSGGGAVFHQVADGLVTALDADGSVRWTQTATANLSLDIDIQEVGAAVALAGPPILLGELSSASPVAVGFIDPVGDPRWLSGFDSLVHEIVIDDAGAYVYVALNGSPGVDLVQLDIHDGTERWRIALPGEGLPYLALDADDHVIVGRTDGSVAKIRMDGVLCAAHGSLEGVSVPPPDVFHDGDVAVDGAGHVYLAIPGDDAKLVVYAPSP